MYIYSILLICHKYHGSPSHNQTREKTNGYNKIHSGFIPFQKAYQVGGFYEQAALQVNIEEGLKAEEKAK